MVIVLCFLQIGLEHVAQLTYTNNTYKFKYKIFYEYITSVNRFSFFFGQCEHFAFPILLGPVSGLEMIPLNRVSCCLRRIDNVGILFRRTKNRFAYRSYCFKNLHRRITTLVFMICKRFGCLFQQC